MDYGWEFVIVPDLNSQTGRHFGLGLVQAPKVLLLLHHHGLLGWQVVEVEHVAPVKVAVAVHRSVVDVGLLFLFFEALKPSRHVDVAHLFACYRDVIAWHFWCVPYDTPKLISFILLVILIKCLTFWSNSIVLLFGFSRWDVKRRSWIS